MSDELSPVTNQIWTLAARITESRAFSEGRHQMLAGLLRESVVLCRASPDRPSLDDLVAL